MSNTTKQLLHSQIGCIDREEIKAALQSTNEIVSSYEVGMLLKDSEYYKYKGMLTILNIIQSQLFPIEPIVKDAWINGSACGCVYDYDENKLLELKSLYLTQPITIKLEDNGK